MAQTRVEEVGDSEDYVSEAGTSDEGIDNSHEPARTKHDGIYGTYVGDVSDRELDDDSTWLDAPVAHVGTCVERSPTPCRPIGEPLDAPPRFELRIMDLPHRHSYTNDNEDAPLAMLVHPRQRLGFVTDELPSSPPPPILLEQRVHRVANIQTSTSCLDKRPNRISRREKIKKEDAWNEGVVDG